MKYWFIWWVSRPVYYPSGWVDRGTWYGPRYITDRDVISEEMAISRNNPGVTPYRMKWSGEEWLYDNRKSVDLLTFESRWF